MCQHARLTEFIKANRAEVISVWTDAVRALPVARNLDRPVLIDHIPELLDRICEIADHVGAGKEPSSPFDVAELHARDRLEEGFDLSQVVAEYRMLRGCILRLWGRTVVAPEQLSDLQALDEAIDISIGASIDRYTRARDRTLQALDRIATEAFGSRNLDELLERLLHVMKETTAAVDTTAILLREGDLLRVRAAVGLGREVERDLVIKVGEGFAGAVAAGANPHTFSGRPEQIVSPILRAAGLATLYGVPLIEDGEVIGVAHMGSRTAREFSVQDKRLFAAMTARATSAIRQHMLHEAAVRASEEAHAREREMRTLADNIPQLAWMADATGARFWFNARWLAYTGAALDEAQAWGWSAFVHPAHADGVVAEYRRAVASREPWEDTFPLRGRDGSYRWFLSRAVPIVNDAGEVTRWFGTNTDITESRLHGEVTAALTSTLDYDEIVDTIVRLAVPEFADWCAVDLVQPDGHTQRVALSDADPPRDASCTTAPLVVRDRTLGAITFARSGAARRFDEPDVEDAQELARRIAIGLDNARLYRDAQEASRLREAVLAIVSHELRAPLGTIDLAATMLLRMDGEPRLRKPIETIRRACERMDKMIGDLLDMATIQAGRLHVELQDALVVDVLRDAVDLHELVAAEKGINIIRDFDLGDVRLRCDRDRMQQVFSNLIGNAKKFGQSGDVILVSAKLVDGHVIFLVRDSGPGVEPDELPHIFEPYWSGQRGRKHGTGLGLYIARAIVRAHGGELSVTSEVGQGAAFSFRLPVSRG